MDHISKALEKASSERDSIRDWVNPSVLPPTKAPTDYSAKEITLDADVLRQHHILSGPGHENAAIADRYRLLRTRSLQLMKPHNWNVLGITSAGPKAGKSLTAMNLALTMARSANQQVLLVDADMRKPSIASDLGFDVEFGLIDYLSSKAELEDVLVSVTGVNNLTILPGRPLATVEGEITPELLNSTKMDNLITNFSEQNDSALVIVDLPPVLIGDDVIAQASHLQCVLLVVEEGATNSDELMQCSELLAGLNFLGTVLNKSLEKEMSFEGYYQMGPSSQS